jgi:FkbM family methyltransferase
MSYRSPFIRRYGVVHGLRVAQAMTHVEYHEHGEPQPISVPGWQSPVWLRRGTTDALVFRQLLIGDELGFSLAGAPRRIIDGGANIGLASRAFAARWPEASIVAVELEAGNVRMAQRNTGAVPTITVMHGALWSEVGTVQVAGEAGQEYGFRASAAPVVGTGVPAMTIESLLDHLGWATVDVVKLDIEGAEREVLSTGARWLPRVRHLVVELHERFAPGCDAAFDAVIDRTLWDVREHGEYLVASRRGEWTG